MNNNWEHMSKGRVHSIRAEEWIINAAFLQYKCECINNSVKRQLSMVLSCFIHWRTLLITHKHFVFF